MSPISAGLIYDEPKEKIIVKGKVVVKEPNFMKRSLNVVKDKCWILGLGVFGAFLNGCQYPF